MALSAEATHSFNLNKYFFYNLYILHVTCISSIYFLDLCFICMLFLFGLLVYIHLSFAIYAMRFIVKYAL